MAEAIYDDKSVAVLFGGQGIFGPGMGQATYRRYAASREVFNQATEAAGIDMARVCFGDLTHFQEDTRIAQPAIATVGLAEYAAWKELHGDPEVVTGLSLGMYPAMAAAGFFESYGDAVDAVSKRARIMYEITKTNPGKMAGVVGLVLHDLEPIVHKAGAEIAVLRDKARHSFVITGRHEEVDQAKREAENQGVRKWEDLNIFGAFHSRLQKGSVEPFSRELSQYTIYDPKIRLLGNRAVYLTTAREVVEHALSQLVEGADWDAGMNRLAAEGIRKVLEVGPDEKRGLARQMVKTHQAVAIRFPDTE